MVRGLQNPSTERMNTLDIILLIPLVWAVWSGFRSGVVVQLGGIAGLVLGVWLAARYGVQVGAMLKIDPSVDSIVGFIIILLLTIIVIAIIGRLLRGLFRFAGLAALDHVGGAVLSVCKVGIILGLLLYGFATINRTQKWVDDKYFHKSILYKPLTGAAQMVFPFVDFVKERLLSDTHAAPADNQTEAGA